MGKASRVRNAKAAVAELKKEQLLKQQQEARRKKKVNIIYLWRKSWKNIKITRCEAEYFKQFKRIF